MADADEAIPSPPPRKSGGLLMNAVVVFVMALCAAVAGGFINAKLHPLPTLKLGKDGTITEVVPVAAPGKGEEGSAKAAVYYAIDPPLVVNFEDGSVVRFLQITMEIMAHDQKAIDSVQRNIPLIRNNLLLLMSNRNYQSLMSRDGKEKLRAEALAEIKNVQKKQGGEDVDDVLFTSFVVQ
ncbi:MAG TPA: flagellar basal body-associated FliL family protein [Steroidobacteraceae bacterium]|jgi:flagellar FliL protein|nr:flagellar basal body-associated FliL family protein [Steroidobacteraceae bacterium]